jgi:hypothetical protein
MLDSLAPGIISHIIMSRLHPPAFDLLDAELKRCLEGNAADLAYHFAIGRLQRLSDSDGAPATDKELRKILIDLAPNIRHASLRQAAKLNRPQPEPHRQRSFPWPQFQQTPWDWQQFAWGSALSAGLSAAGLCALPFLQGHLAGIKPSLIAVAEMEMPRWVTTNGRSSSELVKTAQTFAEITQQSMKTPIKSVAEWQTVVNQWQDTIALLQQVTAKSPEYPTAQRLIQQYQQQQTQAQQYLKTEKASHEALKVAKARVRWFSRKAKGMNPQEKAQAIAQIKQQLKPVTIATTGYTSGKATLAQIEKAMK